MFRKSLPLLNSLVACGAMGAIAFTACVSDPKDDNPVPTDTVPKDSIPSGLTAYGTFKVSLVAPTDFSQGYSTISGKLYTAEYPSVVNWVKKAESGSCVLYTPVAVSCVPACGSSGACVSANTCKTFPSSVSAGTVKTQGLKSKAGDTVITLASNLNNYQVPAGTILEYPPFSEGQSVKFSASGMDAVPAFSMTGKGIAPLQVLADSVAFESGKDAVMKWKAGSAAVGSKVWASVDISHHGGSKGKIDCETGDTGELIIPAALVTQLIGLGVAGYPKIDVARRATYQAKNVSLVMESGLTLPLSIPGVYSCGSDEDCPGGKTCQADLQCK